MALTLIVAAEKAKNKYETAKRNLLALETKVNNYKRDLAALIYEETQAKNKYEKYTKKLTAATLAFNYKKESTKEFGDHFAVSAAEKEYILLNNEKVQKEKEYKQFQTEITNKKKSLEKKINDATLLCIRYGERLEQLSFAATDIQQKIKETLYTQYVDEFSRIETSIAQKMNTLEQEQIRFLKAKQQCFADLKEYPDVKEKLEKEQTILRIQQQQEEPTLAVLKSLLTYARNLQLYGVAAAELKYGVPSGFFDFFQEIDLSEGLRELKENRTSIFFDNFISRAQSFLFEYNRKIKEQNKIAEKIE